MLATRAITENIKKARRAFFAYGSIGAFQGDLSPLSSRSVVETCVMPVLLFGSENWLLDRAMISSLEAFQGEIAKRILDLYQFCITADEGPRTETFCNLVKLMLCYKLNTFCQFIIVTQQ